VINLRAYAKWTWGAVELAAHEMAAVADFVEGMIAKRPVLLDLAAALSPGAKVFVGGIELAAEEIEKVRAFVESMKAPAPTPAPSSEDETPPPTSV
jgi:hypothetical protein